MAEGKPDPGELEDRILPWSQVKVISGLSRTTVWRLQKTGDFPASVQVSRNRVGWWQSEILEWRRSRLPRRLPDPKPVPDELAKRPPPLVAKTSRSPAKAAIQPARDRLVESAPEPARRRRKRTECDNQTAFDF